MARNNTVIVILDYVFGAADTLTAQYFSDLLGVATAETQSIRKETGIEGNFEFGQKNISTLKRNLLNADEILRIPYNQLLVNIRGNKPLLLNKMVYTEHELAKKLKDKFIPCAIVWYKGIKVLIPITHLLLSKQNKSLIRGILGAEIDFIILELDDVANIAIGSRTDAMELRAKIEIPKLKQNDIIRVRIIAIGVKHIILYLSNVFRK